MKPNSCEYHGSNTDGRYRPPLALNPRLRPVPAARSDRPEGVRPGGCMLALDEREIRGTRASPSGIPSGPIRQRPTSSCALAPEDFAPLVGVRSRLIWTEPKGPPTTMMIGVGSPGRAAV